MECGSTNRGWGSMSFNKQTIHDIELAGKRVLLRADYNVPISEKGEISNDYRIQQSLPTIQYLLDRGCKLIICSHLGRPIRPDDPLCTLRPVAKRLGELLDKEVGFADDCIGEETEKTAAGLNPGEILLLENLRYHEEEEKNDDGFAAKLAALADVFVQDGFGVVHRAHASTDAVAHKLPAVAGLLLEKEVDTITNVMENPKRPLMAIVGGAKISDKLDILNRLIDVADIVAVGGAMANTFLLAKGIRVGKSKAEPDDVPMAKEVMEKAASKASRQHFVFYLPQDGVVATSLDKTANTRIVDWDAHVIAAISSYPKLPERSTAEVAENEMILDIGPFSGSFIAGATQLAKTVIWNGAMGVTETPGLNGPVGPFSHGTEVVVEALLGAHGHKPFTVVGGGDTVGYIEQHNLLSSFNHVSTGGGAGLELMSGKKLPGVEALLDKKV